ncbi:hypothetical protein ACFQRL_06850 [Microbacterium fluvii]|uniref:Uncharacterized protein n=1 Tax=Microbacterium fluvii TaxID=415215 RepID=A0ABW2HDT7_9MICO|nr:hypothetical protein [Microbacterium fluvii]MCU4672304.1 hypothetical protein [Microbacterium fluvii]
MRHRALVAAVMMTSLALTACTAVSPAASPSASDPAAGAPAVPSPTASETVTTAVLVVSTTGVAVQSGSAVEEIAYSDGAALVAAVTAASGIDPVVTEEDVPAPYEGTVTTYDWGDGAVVMVGDGPGVSISVRRETLAGLPVSTPSGIAVGSDRADVLAAGGLAISDEDQDGTPEQLSVDPLDAAGTESLTSPGTVGTTFVLVILDGDTVSGIQAPGNDFADV